MLQTVGSFLTSLGLYSALLLAGFWLWFQWSHRELLRVAAKIPVTLPTIPLLGHSYLALRGLEELTSSVLDMSLRATRKGIKISCFWCGPLPLLHLQNVNDIQILLNGSNTSDKSNEYDYVLSGLDSGIGPFRKNILAATGREWKVIRKHLNPLFHPRNVQQLIPVFNANSRELLERMSHHLGHGPFNVMEYTMDVALKTISNLIFGPGLTIDVNTEAFKGFKSLVEAVPEIFIGRILKPWLRFEFLFRLIHRRKIKHLSALWKSFTEIPIKAAKEIEKEKIPRKNIFYTNEIEENLTTTKDQEHLNFFDVYPILRENYPEFTEADMRSEIIMLYMTGTDTVALGTASCLLALAQHQDIQERVYREISMVVGSENDVTLQNLSKMSYLEMVVKETLRRFLIVPYLLRKVKKDVKLSECTVPAGSPVILNLWAVHMDPKLYPNPTKFDPERFSHSEEREKFTYMPFSGGPRICIAKSYAMDLIKIMVIHILRNFSLSTEQDIQNLKKKLMVTLVSVEGYNISLESRHPYKKLDEDD